MGSEMCIRDSSSEDRIVYRPALFGRGRLHFVRASYKVDQWTEMSFLSTVKGGEMPDEIWENAERLTEKLDLTRAPLEGAEFAKPVGDLQKSKNYTTWKKEFKEFLYRGQEVTIWKCEDLKKYSDPGETLGNFKVRLEQLVSENRDDEVEDLRKKYGKKFATLRTRIRKAEDKVEVEEAQYKQSRMSSYLSVGSTIMGALLGRRSTRNTATSVRSFGRSSKEKDDIGRAKDNLEELQIQFEDLEREFNDEVAELEDKMSVENLEYSELSLPPRKSDISVEDFAICWLPSRVDSTGIEEPIY